ncbi:MAG: type II secretory pathway, component PulD, partial [Opitutales bacterium]
TDASNLLSSAASSLTLNTSTEGVLQDIEDAKAEVILMEAMALVEAGDLKSAESKVAEYRAASGKPKLADRLAEKLDRGISNPYNLEISEISPDYVAQSKVIRDLLTKARAQFLNGDYDGAQSTFREVEARDANNAEAKLFQTRIALILGDIHEQNHYKTRAQMMTELDQAWERPKVFDVDVGGPEVIINDGLQEKLNKIVIPQVNFAGMELTRVIETLSELSAVYDLEEQKGVNIVPIFNPNDNNPRVNITLRDLNLDRILQFVTQQVNFSYDVGTDAVTIQPSDSIGGVGGGTTITEFFPITRATVIRLTGVRSGGGGGGGPVDPFAPTTATSAGPSASEETEALQSFFQSAGVNFELPGTSLAFDGEQLIVTQTRRNLERMRTILRNYNEVKQVEIEAKFLEVSQNDLDEFGFDWTITDGARPLFDAAGLPILDENGNQQFSFDRSFTTQGRTLNDAFATDSTTAAINITGIDPIPVAPPALNTAIDLASEGGNIFSATGWSAGNLGIDMAIRALSRKAGTDLMSAPKVTVLSGKKATITVAQELRYPESYGDIESTVGNRGGGNNNNNGGGGSSISITAGTPQDFVTRNVGVELAVTPNVENDDTISLLLEPRVTEFEGFVEYGGPSVAISGSGGGGFIDPITGIFLGGASTATVVTVPAGFYQPIFSTRELSTEVTIFDGATLVMGGLTRDEIKTVNDSVPVLGDIPGIGRLFRSEGETRQKRNLLIFVTANMVSPGGSPARQNYRHVSANSLFQNPTISTPSGNANRSIGVEEE